MALQGAAMACRTFGGLRILLGVTAQISRVPAYPLRQQPHQAARCRVLHIQATPSARHPVPPRTSAGWTTGCCSQCAAPPAGCGPRPRGLLRISSRPAPFACKAQPAMGQQGILAFGAAMPSRYSGEAHSHHSSAPSLRAAQVESARRPKRTAGPPGVDEINGASSTSNRSRNEGYCASIAPRAGETCRAKPTVADTRSSPLGASRAAASRPAPARLPAHGCALGVVTLARLGQSQFAGGAAAASRPFPPSCRAAPAG